MSGGYRFAVGALVLALGGVCAGLHFAPPEMIRVGANYSAKIVCSNVFLAGRDAQVVLADDVQAPGHVLLKLMSVSVDRERQLVHADLLGFIGGGLSAFRPGTGCVTVPDGDLAKATQHQFVPLAMQKPSPETAWPSGSKADENPAVQAIISQTQFFGPGMRGIAVIHKGRLIAQAYGSGFAQDTPLLGWSMTKSVTAALVGMQVGDGKLKLDQQGFWPTTNPSDGREQIKLSDLLSMASGLRFNEGYGDVSDVTRMLYLEPDMAAYVHAQPLEQPVGSVWNYSSGTTVLLSHLWQQAAGANSLDLPHRRLFSPLGMTSAIIEADARGNLVGSSYMYATAQDWARFGQFLLQDGVWNGTRLLPDGYVAMMRSVAPVSKGEYSQGQMWRWGPNGNTPEGENPDTSFNLPDDTFWMLGHDGQSVAIVPSKELVVVRLGLTPHRLFYKPQAMLAEIIKAINP